MRETAQEGPRRRSRESFASPGSVDRRERHLNLDGILDTDAEVARFADAEVREIEREGGPHLEPGASAANVDGSAHHLRRPVQRQRTGEGSLPVGGVAVQSFEIDRRDGRRIVTWPSL